jgi:ribosomal protein S18 acetylase RimI-like enzyme
MHPKNYAIRKITAAETRILRQIVLRPNQKAEDLVYPGDDSPESYHGGIFLEDKLVGIATVYKESRPGGETGNSWRLRGMATLPEVQGQGYGKALLNNCIEYIKSNGGKTLWCNARINALEFYRGLGFETIGETFDIPDIGLHYLMEKKLSESGFIE